MYNTKWKITVYDDFNGKCFCDVTYPEEHGLKTLGQLVDELAKYAINALDKMVIEYAGHTD
jgi:hypothetical protein